MLVSENGKLIELPDDMRAIDKYKIYENTLVVYYAEKGTYSFYVQQAAGLKKEAENLKKEPRFFESGFIWFEESNGEEVLYNTKCGECVAVGNFRINEYDIKVNTKITKKGKIKITNLDNFLLYRIVKVFYFI